MVRTRMTVVVEARGTCFLVTWSIWWRFHFVLIIWSRLYWSYGHLMSDTIMNLSSKCQRNNHQPDGLFSFWRDCCVLLKPHISTTNFCRLIFSADIRHHAETLLLNSLKDFHDTNMNSHFFTNRYYVVLMTHWFFVLFSPTLDTGKY